METLIKTLLIIILAAIAAPFLLYALAVMADNATRDDAYPYSGFCPDSPEADETIYTSSPTICHD